MRCRSARKRMFEFLDGLADDAKRLELEKHLEACPECEAISNKLTRSMDMLHRAKQESTGENFAWKVRLKINQERKAMREDPAPMRDVVRSWNLRYATGAMAAFAVIVSVGLLAFGGGGVDLPENAGPVAVTQTEKVPARHGTESASPQRSTANLPVPPSTNEMISVGAGSDNETSEGPGLIDRGDSVRFDLDARLVQELEPLPTDRKIEYLRTRIDLYQIHLNQLLQDQQSDPQQ
jgi:hypothetical protein